MSHDRLLEVFYTFMKSIDLFVLYENAESESISRDHHLTFTQRPVDNRFFVLPFKLLPKATTKIFLRQLERSDSS
jgi:hypothetical protein